jgi:alanyl-tRNA synthetase
MLVIGNVYEGKPNLTVFLSKPMVDAGFHAGTMVREAAKFIQGGGGGQPFMASAGGKKPEGIDQAVNAVVEMI